MFISNKMAMSCQYPPCLFSLQSVKPAVVFFISVDTVNSCKSLTNQLNFNTLNNKEIQVWNLLEFTIELSDRLL